MGYSALPVLGDNGLVSAFKGVEANLSDRAVDVYRGYQILPKRDFGRHGFLIDGKVVKRGYVVTDGMCNVMPGATWTQTIWRARELVDALIESQGNSDEFWRIVRGQRAA